MEMYLLLYLLSCSHRHDLQNQCTDATMAFLVHEIVSSSYGLGSRLADSLALGLIDLTFQTSSSAAKIQTHLDFRETLATASSLHLLDLVLHNVSFG